MAMKTAARRGSILFEDFSTTAEAVFRGYERDLVGVVGGHRAWIERLAHGPPLTSSA